MNLPRFSVGRPILTTMVTMIVVLLGAVSLSRVQIDLLPAVEMPTVSVRTSYAGASPEVMEQRVTQILEEIIATTPGVEEISSSSSEGSSSIDVTFAWGTNIDTASLDMQGRIEDEINELPDDITRPRVRKFDITNFPVVILGVLGDLDPVELTTLIEDQLRYRFGRIPGVAQVDLWGGWVREIRIALDPARINALDVPLNQVLAAVRNANLDLPAGKIEQGRYEVTLRAPAQYASVDQIRETVVAMRGGAPVTIGQIAEVLDTHEKESSIERINGKRGVRVGIRKQSGANTVEVSSAILREVEAVNRDFPQIEVIAVSNQGNFIERSINNVAQSVLYGGGLAVFVLLFFLRNFRSTVVISLAIPISVIATFALVYFGGFTLNLMTLGGLALGVGMMVDNSIVVLENIFRRRDELHEDKRAAAVRGAGEVATAIVASTITTLVIFLPMIFVQGVSGILFQELAYVIVFSLVCSLLVSLSLVPMLASKLVESPEELHKKHKAQFSLIGRVSDASERALRKLDSAYRDLLGSVLRNRALAIAAAAALLGMSLFLIPLLGTEFLPPSDEGQVRIHGELEVGTRLDIVNEQALRIESIVYPAVPEAISTSASASAGGNLSLWMTLVPARDRQRSNTEIANDLRQRLSGRIPGTELRVLAPQGQFLLNRILGGEEGITVEIRGFDLDTLDLLSRRAMEEMAEVPGVLDINSSIDEGIPQQELTVDRDKAADLGFSVSDVAQAIETAFAGTQAGEFRDAGNSHRILVQFRDAERLTIEEVLDLTLTSSAGERVALRNLVAAAEGRGPQVIQRKDQQRIATVSANVVDRDLGSVARDVDRALDLIARPAGYDLTVAGNYEEQQESFRELLISMILALMLVYMVLACQYESLRDPLVVMCSVPMAAIGVLLTLYLTDTTLNVQSYIGCIMLGGIVVNNAILLVDQAGRLRTEDGMNTRDAVAEAGRRRLRPILMTTLTTMLGLMPLALGIGEGADAQAPLARAVIGGLAGSTLITLVLIPAVYSLFHPDPKGAAVDEKVNAGGGATA
ncbi:MAG: efflux RND transporter permease subunit [Candidatus Hydrogenedentes bacterium]|nr:efflux RND transporter permease subunit [Candidatus Hydrogenedentota bacterium]